MNQYIIYIADLAAFRIEAAEINASDDHPAKELVDLVDGMLDFKPEHKIKYSVDGLSSVATVKTDLIDKIELVASMEIVATLDGDNITYIDDTSESKYKSVHDTTPKEYTDSHTGKKFTHTPPELFVRFS